ncbi:MarR family transcriptional regulator [Paenibacillus nuruki]|uniref:MarR family transcriptional regulator n=1 Tax=Paenibacillus nuruki TaxID=1886670 RepID=UPI00280511D8|nr:MarR family transcriptional regulator [Paenibacillus nuruki]
MAIYKLHKYGDHSTFTEIANRLSVKKSSVVEMVKTLLKHEYVIKKEILEKVAQHLEDEVFQ